MFLNNKFISIIKSKFERITISWTTLLNTVLYHLIFNPIGVSVVLIFLSVKINFAIYPKIKEDAKLGSREKYDCL